MSDHIKIFFDENIGKPLVIALGNLLAFFHPKPQIRHIDEYLKSGIKDDIWLPKVAQENWLVVTADQGKGPGAKLPHLCKKLGIRHVLISGKLHQQPQFEKARAILVVWPELLKAFVAPKGSRFKLQCGPLHPMLKEKNY